MNDTEFRIGSVLRQAAAAAWPGIGRWLALTALIQSPLLVYMISGLNQHLPEGVATMAVSAAVHVAFYVMAEAAVTAAVLAHLRGQRITLGALLGMVLRPAPLLRFIIAYALLSSLLALASFTFRDGYGVYRHWLGAGVDFGIEAVLYLFLVVIIPVLVNEQTGVLEGLKRSVSLGRGHRGSVFWLYALICVSRGVLAVPLVWWASSTEHSMDRMMIWPLMSRLIGPALWGVINVSVYRTLRFLEEGVDIRTTPSVPDARIHAPR